MVFLLSPFRGFPGLWGVPWLCLVSRLRRCLLPLCVPPGSRSRPGRVRRWACPSARLRAPFPGLSPSCGLRRSPPRPGLPRLGVAGSLVLAVSFPFAPFARCPPLLALRPVGWFPFRWPRPRFRSVAGARPAPWLRCSPLVAALALSWGCAVAAFVSLPLVFGRPAACRVRPLAGGAVFVRVVGAPRCGFVLRPCAGCPCCGFAAARGCFGGVRCSAWALCAPVGGFAGAFSALGLPVPAFVWA